VRKIKEEKGIGNKFRKDNGRKEIRKQDRKLTQKVGTQNLNLSCEKNFTEIVGKFSPWRSGKIGKHFSNLPFLFN
jgi:hypothetical protein